MNQYINNTFDKIILADDEPTFLKSTSELLRKEGFFCDCADTGDSVLKKMSDADFDILIADINMPGNSNLELIKKIIELYPSVIVILITAYPSQQTAIEAIGLQVSGYIVKPFDFNLLLKNVKTSIKACKLSKLVKKTKENLVQWIKEMDCIELAMQKGKHNIFENSLNSFLILNTEKITDIFESIRSITNLIDDVNPNANICEFMECPKLAQFNDGIKQAISSIQKTKELYKSKQLGNVREKLEKLLDDKNTNGTKNE
jgi:DNA-binding response OmpR family regulator